MSFPKQNEIELPLLKALHDLGGKAEPKELYPRLAKIFTQLTEEVLAARLPSSPSTFRWHNLVQWSRQRSLPGYGVTRSPVFQGAIMPCDREWSHDHNAPIHSRTASLECFKHSS